MGSSISCGQKITPYGSSKKKKRSVPSQPFLPENDTFIVRVVPKFYVSDANVSERNYYLHVKLTSDTDGEESDCVEVLSASVEMQARTVLNRRRPMFRTFSSFGRTSNLKVTSVKASNTCVKVLEHSISISGIFEKTIAGLGNNSENCRFELEFKQKFVHQEGEWREGILRTRPSNRRQSCYWKAVTRLPDKAAESASFNASIPSIVITDAEPNEENAS